jgi:hypothetical protein
MLWGVYPIVDLTDDGAQRLEQVFLGEIEFVTDRG